MKNRLEELDNLDKRILYELDIDARIPTTKLSRKLRISREKVNYRIGNLIKGGIIRKFTTVIDPAKLGYTMFKLYLKFQNLSKEKEKEMIEWLMQNPFVYWFASAQGRWDMNIAVFANDITHFDEIISEFISKYGKYILEQEFNTTLQVGIKSKNWISQKETGGEVVFVGGRIENINLDRIDVEILKILANNARMSATEIARKTNSTERIVIYRIKQLQKQRIILRFTTSLDLEVLGMQFFKTTINLNIISKDAKNKIINYCKNNPNIGFFIFPIGSWLLEFELIVKDNKQFYNIMNDFREKFSEVKGYETIIFPIEYKFDWMPLCYKVEIAKN